MTSGAAENTPDLPFAFPSYEDWLAVAQQELEGADPTKKLTIKKGDLEILPFYTATAIAKEQAPLLKPSSMPYSGARSWVNTPKIVVTDERAANQKALAYLNSGAEGILFDCPAADLDVAALLHQISLPDCTVSFVLHQPKVNWLPEFIRYAENNFDKKKISGNLWWSSTECDDRVLHLFSGWDQFQSLGILVDSYPNVSDELAHALNKAVAFVDMFSENKVSIQTLLDKISFSVSMDTDFFAELVKLKSLRLLWHQVRGAYQVAGTTPMLIHARSTVFTKAAFQPHGNMIKATTAAMAAIAGGCDSLTIAPEDESNETMSRIAINISTILREESHFSKVADPTAGSYYIDSLTHQLSEKAWGKFQSLVK